MCNPACKRRFPELVRVQTPPLITRAEQSLIPCLWLVKETRVLISGGSTGVCTARSEPRDRIPGQGSIQNQVICYVNYRPPTDCRKTTLWKMSSSFFLHFSISLYFSICFYILDLTRLHRDPFLAHLELALDLGCHLLVLRSPSPPTPPSRPVPPSTPCQGQHTEDIGLYAGGTQGNENTYSSFAQSPPKYSLSW